MSGSKAEGVFDMGAEDFRMMRPEARHRRRPRCLRRARRDPSVIITICLIVASGMLLFSSLPGTVRGGSSVIDPCPHCGGGGPNHVFLTIAAYYNVAQIKLNGSIYIDGQVATLQAGVPVSISVVYLARYYGFGYWESDVGSFRNAKMNSTTFTPVNQQAMGTLALITDGTADDAGTYWGGYITNGATEGISCAGGAYYNVPPTTYVGSGFPNNDWNSMWVGIGGHDGNLSLWQAGIQVVNVGAVGGGSADNYWEPFTEEAVAGEKTIVTEWVGPHSTNFPSQLIISVCTNNGQNTAQIEAYYANTGHSIWWNESSPNFWPDRLTAEWILENPTACDVFDTCGRPALGAFAPFGVENPHWTDNGQSYNEFLAPLTYVNLTDTTYGTQYVNPGQIVAGFGSFPLTYST